MKTKNLDRVIIYVKDLDKALEWFSKIGVVIKEVSSPAVKLMGIRVGYTHKYQMEVVMPVHPLPDTCPTHVKRLAEEYKDKEIALVGLSFRVDDEKACREEAERIGMEKDLEAEVDELALDPIGRLVGMKELILNEKDTLGMLLTFVEYEKFIPNEPE